MCRRIPKLLLVLLIGPLVLSGCSDGPSPDDSATDALSVQTEDGSTAATLETLNLTARLVSRGDAPNVQGRLNVGSSTIRLTGALDEQTLQYDGDGTSLSSRQKEALRRLVSRLHSHYESSEGAMPPSLRLITRTATYLAEAPPDHSVTTRTVQGSSPTAKQDEGISCIAKGTYETAEYDSDGEKNATTGTAFSDRILVGSTARENYECMGRCGAGCDKWYADSAWCKDCLDHDQCSNVYDASGGSDDPNCGDEYDEAADDWLWGVWNGCTG